MIKVHLSGTVDVVFDVDGSVGSGLTKAEHFLKLRVEVSKKKEKPKAVGGTKRKIKVCPVDGCPNQVKARGLCKKHGGKSCLVEGCATKVEARGLCMIMLMVLLPHFKGVSFTGPSAVRETYVLPLHCLQASPRDCHRVRLASHFVNGFACSSKSWLYIYS